MASTSNLFPHEVPRRGQAEFLEEAREAVTQGSILLAQAPTGLGKTAVALASTVECGLEMGGKVLFTTCRRSQHRIAVETLRRMGRLASMTVVDIIAREAMCPDHTSHVAGWRRSRVASVARALLGDVLHVQEVVDLARRFKVCPYETALEAARRADVLVCDYNYLFSPQRRRLLRSLGAGLGDVIVVVDEAHNLPSRAREALSCRMTAEALELMAKTLGSGKAARSMASIARVLRAESKVVGGESKVPMDFLDRLLSRYSPTSGVRYPSKEVAAILEKARSDLPLCQRSLVDEVAQVLKKWREPDRLRILSPRGGGCLALVALDPRPVTRPVFRGVRAALLMSGTLHPGEMYVDILGIPPERSIMGSYVPDFPSENRLLLASKDLSSSYRERPESYEAYAEEIHGLCSSIPGNVAAFFPSYEMAHRVGEGLRALGPPKTLLWERRGQSKAQKEDILRALELGREDGGYLLMAVQGGSLSEGIDYPGDLLRGVIVAGLALNPPQLDVEALRSYYSNLFGRRKAYDYAYLYPALNRMVQCAGRCIRSPEDVGAVVILDRRLLRPFYRSRLPHGFRPTAAEDLAGRVRSFFYGSQHLAIRADQEGGGGGSEADGVDGQEGGGEAQASQGLPTSPAGPGPEGFEDQDGGPSLQGGQEARGARANPVRR